MAVAWAEVSYIFYVASHEWGEVASQRRQLLQLPFPLCQGWPPLWCLRQRDSDHVLCLRLRLSPSTLDTDLLLPVSQAQPPAVLHHFLIVSNWLNMEQNRQALKFNCSFLLKKLIPNIISFRYCFWPLKNTQKNKLNKQTVHQVNLLYSFNLFLILIE